MHCSEMAYSATMRRLKYRWNMLCSQASKKISDIYVATILSKYVMKSLIAQISNGFKNDKNNLPLSPDQKGSD